MLERAKMVFAAIAVSASALAGASAMADVDMSGERVTLIVPFGEGGGTSVYGHFLARMLEKHLPGNPSVIVQNIPGGSSIKGVNTFAREAQDDGKLALTLAGSSFIPVVIGSSAVDYDFKTFDALIASPSGVVIYASGDYGLSQGEGEKLMGEDIVFAARSPASNDLAVLLGLDLLGYDMQTIFGLSSGKSRQAFMRGESTLNYDTAPAFIKHVKPMVEEGTAVPLFSFGFVNEDGEITRDPMFPELPTIFEIYERIHGKPLDGPAGEALKTLINIRVMVGKLIVIPQDTDPEISEAYHAAIDAALSDPEFTSEQGLQVVGPYPQSARGAAQNVLLGAANVSDEVSIWLADWLEEEFDIRTD